MAVGRQEQGSEAGWRADGGRGIGRENHRVCAVGGTHPSEGGRVLSYPGTPEQFVTSERHLSYTGGLLWGGAQGRRNRQQAEVRGRGLPPGQPLRPSTGQRAEGRGGTGG